MRYQIMTGDCRATLATLPDASVQCCVTSPPYWGLRDYGTPEQIGLESTPDAYMAALSNGRSFIGCEANTAYVAMADTRLRNAAPLFTEATA